MIKKTNLSRHVTVLLVLLLVVLGFTSEAQEAYNGMVPFASSFFQKKNDNKKAIDRIVMSSDLLSQQSQQSARHIAKDEERLVTVDFQIVEHDDILSYPWEIVSTDRSIYLHPGENQMPAGTYSFLAYFPRVKADGEGYDCYVIKESVEVNDDMTLIFDADDAIHQVNFDCCDKDGNILPLYHVYIRDNGQWEYVWEQERVVRSHLLISDDSSGCFFNMVGNGGYSSTHFYVSDVENITLQQHIMFDKDDYIHTLSFATKGVHQDLNFVNNPNDYIIYEETYKPSPLCLESETIQMPEIAMATYNYGNTCTLLDHDVVDGKVKYCIGNALMGFDKTDVPNPTLFRFVYGVNDYTDKRVDEDGWVDEWYYSTNSLPILNVYGELMLMNYGKCSGDPTIQSDTFCENGENVEYFYSNPGHPNFSYPLFMKGEAMLGNNCPIGRASFDVYPLTDGSMFYNIFMNRYIGRYGELRESDRFAVKYSLILDNVPMGETTSWIDDSHSNGSIKFTATNNNVDVDGLPGKNVTTLYVDKSNIDAEPPTLTMLHYLNQNDGIITDRFSMSDNGIIEMSACDYNTYTTEEWLKYHTYGEVDVEVSYSPYGEDNWNEISVEEYPSLFYLPDMGYFFRGTLEGVTGQAYEGWFDLKVKVTDAAGNWQEQVISPAFRIDDLAYSSVATVGKDNACEVARYNLAGQRVDASHRGVTIVRMSDGTARKVIN